MIEQVTTHAHILSADTQAVLLLCGRLGWSGDAEPKPLSATEYDRLAQWLQQCNLRPADLLRSGWQSDVPDANVPINLSRLWGLLGRGAALAFAIETWTNKGLWVIGRSDNSYPRRFKTRLGRAAPPLLYGVGNADLLSRGGLAIVGSRDVSSLAREAASRVAQACAQQGIQVISGGARGVDSEAMLAALSNRGCAVGVLADSLAHAAVAVKYRRPLLEDRLVLVSPYDPECGFSVGNAMGRNKHVYALADWGLVISSSVGQGGTWAGATEALTRRRQPIFVWTHGALPEGNRQLLERGARPFPPEPWTDLVKALSLAADTPAMPMKPVQGTLIHDTANTEAQGGPVAQSVASGIAGSADTSGGDTDGDIRVTVRAVNADQLQASVFAAVLPLLLAQLEVPQSVETVASLLDVRRVQAQDWLERTVREGYVTKTAKPVRYVVRQSAPSLFLIPAAEAQDLTQRVERPSE